MSSQHDGIEVARRFVRIAAETVDFLVTRINASDPELIAKTVAAVKAGERLAVTAVMGHDGGAVEIELSCRNDYDAVRKIGTMKMEPLPRTMQ